ncbi:hypothetical protein FLONG3_1328 [Fusarium longipes]|uniref:Sulfatase N-terminal domain-containing protein n=1 Tax=Fusarium longipes TaxID=694270 RepID=A0A395T840_9HYPO|nr:hypothetical protein FLONG3_1328 [Fusarium longipes]
MSATVVQLCFSITCISLIFTKFAHLSLYIKTVSPVGVIFFLPSLLLSDLIVICLSRLALRPKTGSITANTFCLIACVFSIILWGAASSQLGFLYETGVEIKWADTLTYVGDKNGMKVLLSGLYTVLSFAFLILAISWVVKWYLYRAVGEFCFRMGAPITYTWLLLKRTRLYRGRHFVRYVRIRQESHSSASSVDENDENDDVEKNALLGAEETQNTPSIQLRPFLPFLGTVSFLFLTTVCRPSRPYNMMSATLPVAMLEMFKIELDPCAEQTALSKNKWPLPDLIEKSKWETPNGHFKGWAPGIPNKHVKHYRDTIPTWLPEEIPNGFLKWSANNTTESKNSSSCFVSDDDSFYNPVSDPLKITNLNDNILDVLQEAFKNETVKIRHVALIMMESHREELFPLQQGSDYHQYIMKSHGDDVDEDVINERLHQLGPVAERITGKSGNFKKKDGSDFDPVEIPEWKDTTPDGFGGINIVGGFTTSSLSMKSAAAIHCGSWCMPVNSFEESETQSYQPCLPQILNLFNNIKENKTTDEMTEQQWEPAFFQSITEGYDRQDKFDRKIGFKEIIAKDRLDKDTKEGEELEKINYFGYAETLLDPYIRDYIKNVTEQGKRMFLSHFTSTTHHPWGLPKSVNSTDYLETKDSMSMHQDLNWYLKAVRFTDAWLGQLLQILQDTGIADETLIVFVGDHGQAFPEDSPSKTGTYGNGHVSNFRVPITFRHPKIPRVQYNANATSLSILPTILDLLISTRSLNEKDTQAATDILWDYEGQSLIRPYKASHNGRRAWNFGIINGGGSLLSMTSADAPWRLVLPLDDKSEYRFTDLKDDPLELKPLEEWKKKDLFSSVKSKYGEDAAQWATEAEAVSRWWGLERKRLWGYNRGESGDKKADE